MILHPVSSIFPCSPLPCRIWRTPCRSIPWCCLPTFSSVCLVFFPPSLCLARWFWPDLMNRRHVYTMTYIPSWKATLTFKSLWYLISMFLFVLTFWSAKLNLGPFRFFKYIFGDRRHSPDFDVSFVNHLQMSKLAFLVILVCAATTSKKLIKSLKQKRREYCFWFSLLSRRFVQK